MHGDWELFFSDKISLHLVWLQKWNYWQLVETYHRQRICYLLHSKIANFVDAKVHYFLDSECLYYRQHFITGIQR